MDASTSAVLVAPMNAFRRGLILWNDSTATVHIKLGLNVSTNDFTWRLSSQSGYELLAPIYQGDITAIWETATGGMMITELV